MKKLLFSLVIISGLWLAKPALANDEFSYGILLNDDGEVTNIFKARTSNVETRETDYRFLTVGGNMITLTRSNKIMWIHNVSGGYDSSIKDLELKIINLNLEFPELNLIQK